MPKFSITLGTLWHKVALMSITLNKTSRWWVFTLHEPRCLPDFSLFPCVRYAVHSEEISDSGKYHLQGYVELTRTQRLSFMKKILRRAHWEMRYGTQAEAIAYCSKTTDPTFLDGPHIYGTPCPGQGSRTDVHELHQSLANGADLRSISNAHFPFFLRYHTGIEKYISLNTNVTRQRVRNYYYYGKPGTGKSTTAHLLYDADSTYTKAPGPKWFDGINTNCRTLILDEYRSWLDYSFLLRIMDPFSLPLESKGYSTPATYVRTIITTNLLPEELHPEIRNKDAFIRRVSNWVFFSARPDEKDPLEFESYTLFLKAVQEQEVKYHNDLFKKPYLIINDDSN